MAYWFVFDAVNGDGRQNAIRKVIQGPVTIHMRLAKSPLPMAELAAPQTQVTAGGAVVELFLQAGFD
jgi:hypothetical protein